MGVGGQNLILKYEGKIETFSLCIALSLSGCRNRGVEFKGGSLHDGFGSFDGIGVSGDHLSALLLAQKKQVQEAAVTVSTVLGGFGGCGRDG